MSNYANIPNEGNQRIPDVIGKKFNDLEVISFSHIRRNGQGQSERMWTCKCKCGDTTKLTSSQVNKAIQKSCGCARRRSETETFHNAPRGAENFAKHSLSKLPEYTVWKAMQNMCLVKEHLQYPNHGGKGIKVCHRWRVEFGVFLQDMGKRPSDEHVIVRINKGEGFYPENCKWGVTL